MKESEGDNKQKLSRNSPKKISGRSLKKPLEV